MAAKLEPILTIADLDATPDDGNRYELIEGELYVSRAPGLKHQRISGNIFEAFRIYLRSNHIGEALATPGVIFSEYSGVIPDLIYISNERRAGSDARTLLVRVVPVRGRPSTIRGLLIGVAVTSGCWRT